MKLEGTTVAMITPFTTSDEVMKRECERTSTI